jgi:hypothetical protein
LKRLLVPVSLALLLPLALAHTPTGTPKPYAEPVPEWTVHEYGPPASGASIGPRIDGWALGDGHKEFAVGGAYILVFSGGGAPSVDANESAGSVFCHGEAGHHPAFGPVSVFADFLGAGVTFTVAADNVDLGGSGRGCGDGVSDNATDCIGTCTVTFPPGLDGAYRIYIQGVEGGHVIW